MPTLRAHTSLQDSAETPRPPVHVKSYVQLQHMVEGLVGNPPRHRLRRWIDTHTNWCCNKASFAQAGALVAMCAGQPCQVSKAAAAELLRRQRKPQGLLPHPPETPA